MRNGLLLRKGEFAQVLVAAARGQSGLLLGTDLNQPRHVVGVPFAHLSQIDVGWPAVPRNDCFCPADWTLVDADAVYERRCGKLIGRLHAVGAHRVATRVEAGPHEYAAADWAKRGGLRCHFFF
ncbi:MAG: hypothetical protein CL454_00760 [Acidimicrobiaceae bacterium]|nr:hypothetical protein [Acidimicrobiaceae bacterium]